MSSSAIHSNGFPKCISNHQSIRASRNCGGRNLLIEILLMHVFESLSNYYQFWMLWVRAMINRFTNTRRIDLDTRDWEDLYSLNMVGMERLRTTPYITTYWNPDSDRNNR